MWKTYAILEFAFNPYLIIPQFKVLYFGKKYCHLTNRSEERVDLLQQFVALLQFLSAVLQHGAGAVVFPQPLLVGFFLEVHISKAKCPQACKGARIRRRSINTTRVEGIFKGNNSTLFRLLCSHS